MGRKILDDMTRLFPISKGASSVDCLRDRGDSVGQSTAVLLRAFGSVARHVSGWHGVSSENSLV